MSDVNTLVTYGGGEILIAVFNAIAAGVGDSGYQTILRLAGLFALTWVIVEVAIKMNYMRLLTWLGSFYLMLNLLLVPKMTIVIDDKLQTGLTQPVDNVPIGIGYFAVLSSQIGYALTTLCDELFSLPDDLQYSQTGLVMGARLVSDAMRFQVTDSTFSQNLTSFMQQCVFYDLLLGKYTASDLFNAPNIWGFVTQNASPARAFKYITDGGIGESATIYTCQDGVNYLNTDWNKEINQAATVYGQRFFATSDTNAKSELLSRLPIALGYLSNTSQSAEDIMMQAMSANAIQHALLGNGAETGASAAVGQYASTRAEQMQMSKFLISGDLAAHWLSIMQNVIEALLYGGFLIVVLTMLMPVGFRVMLSYLQSILWVQLWAPLYAILNLVMTLGARQESVAALANTAGAASAFTLNTYAGLAKVNADMAAFAGFATLSIPLISWGMVKFSGLAVTSLASSLASVSQSIAGQVASEASSGNFSYGNLHYDTVSAFNTSANHFNTNESYQAGMSAYQSPTGALIQHTQDGSTVINSQGAISSTGTSINLADSMRAQASLQADHALSSASSSATAYSQSMASAFKSAQDFSHSIGKHQSSDESYSKGYASNVAHSAETINQSVSRFAADHHLSNDAAARLLGEAYAKAHAGASLGGVFGVSGGLSVSGSESGSAAEGKTWRDALDTVSQQSFRQSVDEVARASHDSQYRTGNDASDRALSHISSAFDSAMQAREDASHQLTLADSYRQTASFAKDNAVSINTNNSQSFVNWLMTQSDGQGGTLGAVGAEQLLNSNPALSREYANQFVSEQVNQLSQAFAAQSHHMSPESITKGYEAGSQATLQQAGAHFEQTGQQQREAVQGEAASAGLTSHNINSGLADGVNQTLAANHLKEQAMEKATVQAMDKTNQEKSHLSGKDKSLLHQAATESTKILKDTL